MDSNAIEIPEGLEPLPPRGEEPWSVQTLEDADWALERLAELEEQVRENNALLDLAVARLRARASIINEKAQKGISFFRAHLEAYAKAHRADLLGGGKKKTRELPHGSIAFRKSGGRLEVRDAEAALAWAQSQPIEAGLVRIKEELDKRALNEWHARTGEVPPGAEVTPEGESVVIEAFDGEVSNGN